MKAKTQKIVLDGNGSYLGARAGTIYGESWTSVDSNIYYSGSELVSWTLTLEWTS
jgi:hypothetical protein